MHLVLGLCREYHLGHSCFARQVGWLILCRFTLSAEIFPLAIRGKVYHSPTANRNPECLTYCAEIGMSFAVFWNFLGLGLLILFVPKLTSAFGKRDQDDGHTNLLALFVCVLPFSPKIVFANNCWKWSQCNCFYSRVSTGTRHGQTHVGRDGLYMFVVVICCL